MSLPRLFIKLHVMAWMVGLFFMIFGIISFDRIPVQKLPAGNLPSLMVTIRLPGGSPDAINRTITKRVEEAVNKINGVKEIHAISQLNEAKIQLDFEYGQDMSLAVSEVQSELNLIADLFPANTKPPVIELSSMSNPSVMLIAFYGQESLDDMADFVYQNVSKKLAGIDGVAKVEVDGVGEKSIHVVMDLNKMARFHLSPSDIVQAFEKHHVDVPGGVISNSRSKFVLDLDMEYHSPEALKDMVIFANSEGVVHLEDVATVEYNSGDTSGEAILDGKPAIAVSVMKKPLGNTLELVDEAKRVLDEEVKPILPPTIQYKVVYEEASYVKSAVHDLGRDAILSVLSASLVIFCFLLSVRSTVIVSLAIPVSLLGSVAAIYFLGLSFNIITLLAIILLVGIVVDDAIIVLENVDRHMDERDLPASEVAGEASDEVVFAVFASTLTLVAIFLPVIFLTGELGVFFKSLSAVMVAGVIISFIVSLSMTPMLCARFLKHNAHFKGRFADAIHGFLKRLEDFYRGCLVYTLKHPVRILIAFVFLVALQIPAGYWIPKQLVPSSVQDEVFQVDVDTPVGSSNIYVQSRLTELAKVVTSVPGVSSYFSTIDESGKGSMTVQLVPKKERPLKRAKILAQITEKMNNIPGAIFSMGNENAAKTIDFQVRGPEIQKTYDLGQALLKALSQQPVFSQVFIQMGSDQPTLKVDLNRALVSKYGLVSKEVLSAISSLSTDGLIVGYFTSDASAPRTEINLKSAPGQFNDGQDLYKLQLRNAEGKLVNLQTIASFKHILTLGTINRDDLQYSTSLSAVSKVSLGKAIAVIQTVAHQVLPQGYHVSMVGEAASYQETLTQIFLAVGLSLILIYLVLASQFNSFLQPLIVMLAIPLAMTGGLLFLWVSTLPLNIYSAIGLLLLMGLVAKNSILLIDLTNHLRVQENLSIEAALLKACPIRMRPVIMTSLAIIAAMLPSALAQGIDASNQRGLSLVIIGGMLVSTVLSLIMVPAAYLKIETALLLAKQKAQTLIHHKQ